MLTMNFVEKRRISRVVNFNVLEVARRSVRGLSSGLTRSTVYRDDSQQLPAARTFSRVTRRGVAQIASHRVTNDRLPKWQSGKIPVEERR